MNIDTLREILSRYYEKHDSRYVFGGRKGKAAFFYNKIGWDWYLEYVKSLDKDFFNKPGAPQSMFMSFNDGKSSGNSTGEPEIFVSLRQKKTPAGFMDYTTLTFYPITEYKFLPNAAGGGWIKQSLMREMGVSGGMALNMMMIRLLDLHEEDVAFARKRLKSIGRYDDGRGLI